MRCIIEDDKPRLPSKYLALTVDALINLPGGRGPKRAWFDSDTSYDWQPLTGVQMAAVMAATVEMPRSKFRNKDVVYRPVLARQARFIGTFDAGWHLCEWEEGQGMNGYTLYFDGRLAGPGGFIPPEHLYTAEQVKALLAPAGPIYYNQEVPGLRQYATPEANTPAMARLFKRNRAAYYAKKAYLRSRLD